MPTSSFVASLVCLKHLPASGDWSLQRKIDDFLDRDSKTLALPEAYEAFKSNLLMLEFAAAHEPTTMDPSLRRWRFNNVAGCAAARGEIETVRWLTESYFPGEFMSLVVEEAAKDGHLDLLKWLWEHHRSRCCWGWSELKSAVENKRREVADWLCNRILPRPEPESVQEMVKLAARYGDVEIVWWLCKYFEGALSEALESALQHCQTDVILWVCGHYKHDLSCQQTIDIGRFCAREGMLEVLKQLTPQNLVDGHGELLNVAAQAGHMDVVKWLVEEVGPQIWEMHSVELLPKHAWIYRSISTNGIERIVNR